MNNPNKAKTPDFLKGATVDEKGLPLRMKIDCSASVEMSFLRV